MPIKIKAKGIMPPQSVKPSIKPPAGVRPSIKPPVKSIAPKDDAADQEAAGLVSVKAMPEGLKNRTMPFLEAGAKVVVISDFAYQRWYKKGDTGRVKRHWPAVSEALKMEPNAKGLDLYEIALDNPRDMVHDLILLRRWEIEEKPDPKKK